MVVEKFQFLLRSILKFIFETDWVSKALSNPRIAFFLVIAGGLVFLGFYGLRQREDNLTDFDYEPSDVDWVSVTGVKLLAKAHGEKFLFVGFVIAYLTLFQFSFSPYAYSPGNDAVVRAPVTSIDEPVKTPSFRINIHENSVIECGKLCKDVNATAYITNDGSAIARGVEITLILRVDVIGLPDKIDTIHADIDELKSGNTRKITRTVRFQGEDLTRVALNGCAVNYTMNIDYRSGDEQFEGFKQFNKSRCPSV